MSEAEEFDAGAAFFKSLTGLDEVPQEDPDEAEEAPKEPTEEAPKEPTEGEEETPSSEPDPEDAEFEIKLDDKTEKAKLRDLKAAWTTRVQAEQQAREASERRQLAEGLHTTATTALTSLHERAKKALEPYLQFDYVVLAQQLAPEDLQALRQQHAAALEQVHFLERGVQDAVRAQREAQAAETRKAAQAALAELQDPQKGIKGFNQELYGQLVDHATTYGIPREMALSVTHPGFVKLINDAMQFRAGQAAADVAVKKVTNKPTTVMRPSGSSGAKVDGTQKALDRLRKTGNADDAVSAWLENLTAKSSSDD